MRRPYSANKRHDIGHDDLDSGQSTLLLACHLAIPCVPERTRLTVLMHIRRYLSAAVLLHAYMRAESLSCAPISRQMAYHSNVDTTCWH